MKPVQFWKIPWYKFLVIPPSTRISGCWWHFFEVGLHTIQQTIIHNKSNRQADLDPAPLPLVFLPKFSSQTDIGVEIVQSRVRFVSGINNTWVRHCHVIENYAATDHETSLDFSSLGQQKYRPFPLRFEEADWQNFMSHLEYIFISWIRIWLSSTKARILWAISQSPLSWNWDALTGREVILWWWKHIFFTEDFLIYHIIQIYI